MAAVFLRGGVKNVVLVPLTRLRVLGLEMSRAGAFAVPLRVLNRKNMT